MKLNTNASLKIKSKVWIEANGERVFGTGLADLLSYIDKLGSLKSSAAALEISYRKAWDMIKGAEKRFGGKLIESCPGGAGGGKSTLTPMGHRLLGAYIKINAEVAQYSDALFEDYFRLELTK